MERVAALIMLFVALVRVSSAQPFSLDTSFKPVYAFVDPDFENDTGFISDLHEENDGRIMLVGGFTDESSSDRTSWVRLLDNGQLDYSWNPPSGVNSLGSVQKVGNSYLFWRLSEVIVTTLTGNFSQDYSLPIDSGFNCGALGSPYVFEDGSFLAGIGGCAYPHPGNVQRVINFMRVGSDGYVDTSFYHHANDRVGRTFPYDSTRILCYGNWVTEYDGFPVNRVFRIYKDGTLDTTFNAPSGFTRMGYPIHVQEDGKVILGINYALIGADTLTLFRLHSNGDFDSTFNFQPNLKHPYWPIGSVIAVSATSDGGYLFGGVFSEFDGYRRNNIVKTDGDGQVDTLYLNGLGIDSVKSGLGFPPGVNKIVPGQNDTYYVMGQFLMFNGQPVKPIIRLLGLSHTVGVEEVVVSKQLKVFPNPASDYATFEWDMVNPGQNTVLSILDATGRIVKQIPIDAMQGQWLWDTRRVPRGLFLYELRDADGTLRAQGKLTFN